MMEMDGRDSAKCQKSKLGDIDGILGKDQMIIGQKRHSVISLIQKAKRCSS